LASPLASAFENSSRSTLHAVAVDVHLLEELLDLLLGHRLPSARARQHRAQLR